MREPSKLVSRGVQVLREEIQQAKQQTKDVTRNLRDTQDALEKAVTRYQAAEAENARLREIEMKYRASLWLGHGCTHALYGDDGEMQCNDGALHGLLDFKRQPLDELEAALWQLTLKRHAALTEPRREEEREPR